MLFISRFVLLINAAFHSMASACRFLGYFVRVFLSVYRSTFGVVLSLGHSIDHCCNSLTGVGLAVLCFQEIASVSRSNFQCCYGRGSSLCDICNDTFTVQVRV